MSLAVRKTLDFCNVSKWIVRRDHRALCSIVEKDCQVLKKEEITRPSNRKRGFNNPLLEYRHAYPEFLPDPKPQWRNSLREKLERIDMINRRMKIIIPEFYVGSILAVNIADPHAQGKTNRFVGICIERKGCGVRAEFTLRNVVDHQGIEIRYLLYDPTIQTIQVIRLEKRLDNKLYYLRDALPEYSTFPFDMEPQTLAEGTPVPVNPIKVILKPKPWLERWERQELKGIENIEEYLKEKDRVRRELRKTPWEKYDLMKQYRETIPVEDQSQIWSEVYDKLEQTRVSRKKMARIATGLKSELA